MTPRTLAQIAAAYIEESGPLQQIDEAFSGSKFKVGDKVGVMHPSSWGVTDRPGPAGTIKKINGHGHHTVEFDHGEGTKSTMEFDKNYHKRGTGSAYHVPYLVSHEQHAAAHAKINAHQELQSAHSQIHEILRGHTNGHGHFMGFSKESADKLSELIKKHTRAE